VDDNDKLVGIFTERDVVKCANKNVPLDKAPLKNLMSTNITTFEPTAEISSVIQVVAKEKIRHMPVVENDKIIGIITYRDLVSHVLPEVIYMAESIY
jgi:CBS domain-containing protein